MAETSAIEWTDSTWNVITGCSLVSPGCAHCYAMKLAGGRLRNHPSRRGLTRPTKNGPVWTGAVRFNDAWLYQPFRWSPRRIFVCAHGDLFHESVPDEWIDRVFAVMALNPQHVFQVLTKRPERMREYMTSIDNGDAERLEGLRDVLVEGTAQKIHAERTGEDPSPWLAVSLPLPNVWLGVSVEDPDRRWRVSDLVETPAAVRFVSAEPLLGAVDLAPWLANAFTAGLRALGLTPDDKLDWVIAGGESGPNARPMHPDWVRSIRDQCAAAGVPFFFKQWGEWAPTGEGRAIRMTRVGKKAAGALLDGRRHLDFPDVERRAA